MIFEAPWYAVLIVILPICVLLYGRARRRKKAALDQLIGTGMKLEPDAAAHRGWMRAGVVACLVLALMQPLFGKRAEDMPRSGRDIVVLLDTSLSMLAEDVEPNRIERAKAVIRELVDAVKTDGGHRLALVAFAGRPSLQSPLTLDYDLFLERLDETTVETITYEGSLIGDAIHHALERLGGLKPGFADIILVTDGEDHGGLPIDGAAAAAAADIDLYTLGIGDPEVGAPIPVVDTDGERSLLEYDGFEVRSRVHATLLADMAQLTKGRYLGADAEAAAASGTGAVFGTDAVFGVLRELYRDTLATKPRRELVGEGAEMPAHRFQWFVLVALILLILDQLWVGRSVENT